MVALVLHVLPAAAAPILVQHALALREYLAAAAAAVGLAVIVAVDTRNVVPGAVAAIAVVAAVAAAAAAAEATTTG